MILSVTGALSAADSAPLVLRGKCESLVERAWKAGFDGLEIQCADPDLIDCKSLHRELDKKHMRLIALGTGPVYGKYGFSLSSGDESNRKSAIEYMKRFILVAQEFGSTVIIGLLKGKVKDADSEEIYYERLEKSLSECLEFAKERNVTIVLEAINRYESDVFNTVDETLAFIRKLPYDNLKLHIDTFHMNIEESNVEEAVFRAGAYIGHVHTADSDRWYPGHGHFDFGGFIHALKTVGYEGPVSQESLYYPDQELSAREGARCIRQLITG